VEQSELQKLVSQNREMEKKLTKKNDQFLFDLNKILDESEIDGEKKVVALNHMLTELVEGQKKGHTAKQLYGTPTEAADNIINAPEPLPEMTFGKIMLDNSLLMFTFLSALAGLMPLLSNSKAASQGLTSLVLGAVSGAFSFYLIYKYVFIYDTPGADQTNRPGALKSGGLMALCFIPWVLIFSLSAMLPPAINPMFDPVLTLVLGALAFGLRYVLKKKIGLQGTILRSY